MKKPVVIEAVQWSGDNFNEIKEFCGQIELPMENCPYNDFFDVAYYEFGVENNKDFVILKIRTIEGDHIANVGDYIIKGVRGECYPCKKDIFEETYEIL